ncbi:MAG TPA: glycosyltransferase family 39 protein, partial [Vicinamibacteria bacterium]
HAFALVSVLFYAAFTAAVCRLAARRAPALALPAGLYVAFAPAFVTRYSLSNDGNYVEVLALGAWALVAALHAEAQDGRRPGAWLGVGLLLGLAFWCHLLAVIYAAALGLWLLARGPRRAISLLPPLALGFVLGALPSLLWNAANGWESFLYLMPGGTQVGSFESGPGLFGRLRLIAATQAPVLLGYDPGYGPAADALLWWLSLVAVGAAAYATLHAARRWWRERDAASGLLLLVLVVNAAAALFGLPALAGNPRYLLFVVAPLAVFLAEALGRGPGRALLAAVVALGAVGSLAQAPGAWRADRQWRALAAGLEAEGERHCYTDFFISTKINFLSRERVVCSSELGPSTAEYFLDYRGRVAAAPRAAYVAANGAQAEKLERRLQRLGVAYERRDLMKPVLLHLARKVDPTELFPDR